MFVDEKIWLAKGDVPVYLLPNMANRHGLIAGATGTGKTTTLKVMAESFSDSGVPVFLSDIKGDLASLAVAGSDNPKTLQRMKTIGIDTLPYRAYPVCFWDIYGTGGHPVRTCVSEMGPLLLARLLGLNGTQEGVLSIVFRIADDKGLLLLDLKDLRAMVQYVGDHAKEFTLDYGNVSAQSVGAILRSLLTLEDQGGEYFFGEPALNIEDLIRTDKDGRGVINILHSVKLYQTPVLYATFLLWMLSELFEVLPEVGDLDKPKLVFFFDEAHLLFGDAPKVLLEKIEQVVRLIRSKGVGVYFITQSPTDLPPKVLGQLGNRVQHALRAYSPADQKAVKTAAQTFRANPLFKTEAVITELATGEVLISCLDGDGRPGVVERGLVVPPLSMFGTIDDGMRKSIIAASPMGSRYAGEIDRQSAYEILQDEARQEEAQAQREREMAEQEKLAAKREKELSRRVQSTGRRAPKKTEFEKIGSAALSTFGREVGRSLVRGLMGSLRK